MQTFFNPTTPFFDGEGHLLVGAAVSFLDTGTSGSLITIKDSDGVTLPNPLYTGSDGRMRLDNGNGAPAVPCIADGLSYKVAVARRTGVEPVYVGSILQNAAELYEEPYIVFVVTAMGNAEGEELNTTCVGSIAEVRLVDKAIGTVVCSGYYSAGDCPARVFKWVNSVDPPSDNAVNVLRNPDDASGYWKMNEPEGGLWDVRMAGCMTSNTPSVNDQCLTRLLNIVNGYAGNSRIATVYFPEGNWLLDSGFVCGSVCLEKGANLKPADNTSDRIVAVSHLENRGGRFCAYDAESTSSKRVIPKVTGLLCTSWLVGTLNEFLTANAMENVSKIVFDDSTATAGSASVSISGKVVVLIYTPPLGITFEKCAKVNLTADSSAFESEKLLADSMLKLGGDYTFEVDSDNGNVEVKYRGNKVASIEMSGFYVKNFSCLNGKTDFNYYFAGTSDDIGDSKFERGKVIAVEMSGYYNSGTGLTMVNINAEPVAGRMIKFIANTPGSTATVVDNTGDSPETLCNVAKGCTVWIVASDGAWTVDWTRF